MNEKVYAVAIDGPGGAGKSSIARKIARELGILYVDTGAIYRTVGYHVYLRGQQPADAEAVIALYEAVADITAGKVNADNYETVKTQLAAAVDAYNAANGEVQMLVDEALNVAKIERAVGRALEQYENEKDAPADPTDPQQPTDPSDPVDPADPTDPEQPGDEGQGGLNPVVIIVIAVSVLAVVAVVIIVAKKKK